jgi:hypothetical protein
MSPRLISLCLVLIVGGGGLVTYLVLSDRPDEYRLLGLSIVMSMFLAALPLLICYVQTTSLQRQIAKLDTLNDRTVSRTSHFIIAKNTLSSINPATLDKYYSLPMLTFAFVVLFCWLMTTGAYFAPDYFQRNNVILGGVFTLEPGNTFDAYQRGTFVAGCFGFLGAYIYTNWRLLDRINNNDIYPISFYYYSARILAACFIAGVIRHILPDFGGGVSIILLSFAVGFIPDLFITAIVRRASEFMKVLSEQPDPKRDVLPTNYSLLMIQGIDGDKVDRLSELYVTNAEMLACQNPFMLWLRLPYELLLLIDWISQAQLYRIMKEVKFSQLRDVGICGSLDFEKVVSDADAREAIAKKIGLEVKIVESLLDALRADPLFIRLAQVQDALRSPM